MGILDREPIGRRLSGSLGKRASPIRNGAAKTMRSIPRVGERNLGQGIIWSAALSGAITLLEDVAGVPFGGAVETVGSEFNEEEGYMIYTVDVNAPTENIARARSFINAGTGFTAYITDKYDVEDVQVTGKRIARDTYRVTLRME